MVRSISIKVRQYHIEMVKYEWQNWLPNNVV